MNSTSSIHSPEEATAPSTGAGLCLQGDRAEVARESIWEAEAMIDEALRVAARLSTDDAVWTDKLVLRGLLARVKALNSVAMSIVCAEDLPTDELQRAVYGTREVH